MGEFSDWVHVEAIQALVHHATAVIAAIFLFGITARLIAYLIPDGHAKKIVLIVDDVILLAVFVLAGWRLLEYMSVRPHLANLEEGTAQVSQPKEGGAVDGTDDLIAQCRKTAGDGTELQRCLDQKNAEARQALAQAAARMAAEMHALDKVGAAKAGAAHSFDAAQAAFVLYRQAECRWRSTAATNGASENIYRACMASLARQRAAQIERILRK